MATQIVDQITGNGETVAYKAPCRVATTGNIVLSGLLTVDGVLLAANDRVLVKDQTDAKQNGIYIASTGIWQRSRDFDSNRDVTQGTKLSVIAGTVANREFALTSTNPISVGTSNITFALADDVASAAASAVAAAASALAAHDDAAATAEDRIATGEDATATAADRVQTGEDRTAASTSAGDAAGSASSASGSAATATTAKNDALTAKTAAQAAQTAAEAARDQTLEAFDAFDDRYLGEKSSTPTTDNDGDPLIGGALYFDTALGMRLWNGSEWIAAYVSGDSFYTKTQSDDRYATAAEGAKANTAVQPGDLGTAAGTDASAYATAEQGGKADTAVQPAAIAGMVTSTDVTSIVKLTQAAYDALTPPNASTLYLIVG